MHLEQAVAQPLDAAETVLRMPIMPGWAEYRYPGYSRWAIMVCADGISACAAAAAACRLCQRFQHRRNRSSDARGGNHIRATVCSSSEIWKSR